MGVDDGNPVIAPADATDGGPCCDVGNADPLGCSVFKAVALGGPFDGLSEELLVGPFIVGFTDEPMCGFESGND